MKTIFSLRPKTTNIGNELVGLAADIILRSIWNNEVNLVNLPAAHGSASRSTGLTASTIWEINQLADGLIVGPGNLFENGGLHVEPGALSALSVPAMILSASSGRVFDRIGQLVPRTDSLSCELLTALCRKSNPILVRDVGTCRHLSDLRIREVRVVGCPALFLEEKDLQLPPPDSTLADTILISLRDPGRMSVPFSFQWRVSSEIRTIIDFFRKHGDVRLLCHDYVDLRFARAFPDVKVMYSEDSREFLSWLRDCRLNISFRLHAFLCCVALGTPSIPLNYDERGISMLETVGFQDWAVDYIRSTNVLADLQDRYETLGRIEELKELARPAWATLKTEMRRGLENFAAQVTDHSATRIF